MADNEHKARQKQYIILSSIYLLLIAFTFCISFIALHQQIALNNPFVVFSISIISFISLILLFLYGAVE